MLSEGYAHLQHFLIRGKPPDPFLHRGGFWICVPLAPIQHSGDQPRSTTPIVSPCSHDSLGRVENNLLFCFIWLAVAMALMTREAALALVILVLALCRGVEGEWGGRHAVSGEGRRPRLQGFGSPLSLLMPRTLKPVRARMPVLMLRGGSGSSMEMEENEGSEPQQQDEQGGGDSISISASVDDDSKGTRVESISESE